MKKTRGLPKANKPRASTKKINIDLKKHDVRVKKMPPVVNKQKYLLSLRHQLIDLNKSFKNFKLQFQVISSAEGKEFHAIVLNQEQLDTISDLNSVEMKMAKGKIGGTIVADNNKYQNYFLILRAVSEQDSVEVEVTTSLEEIEPKVSTGAPPGSTSSEGSTTGTEDPSLLSTPVASSPSTTSPSSSDTNPTTGSTFSWRRVVRSPLFWLVVIVILGALAYLYYTQYYLPRLAPVSTVVPPLGTETLSAPLSPLVVPAETISPPSVALGKDSSGKQKTIKAVQEPTTTLPTPDGTTNGNGALYSKLKQLS